MSYSRRRFLKTAAAGFSGVALSSCGWTLAKVQTDRVMATASDELHIYTWANYIDQELIDAFRAKTGIKVTFDVFDSNEMMLATFQAGKAGIYSVIYPSDYKVTEMIRLGYLAELDHLRLESLNNLLPRFQRTTHDLGNRYSVPMSWGTTGLLYNSEKITNSLTDWNYLWENKDKLKRRITLINDVREVLGATLRSLAYSYNSKNPAELQKAYDRLQELKPAIATFTTNGWRDQLIAGDLSIAMAYSSDALLAISQEPKLRYVIPASGTSIWSDTMVIPKTAPNPDAAYAWIEFMLRPEVAAKVTERLSFATTNQAAIAKLPEALRSNPGMFPSTEIIDKSESILPMERTVLEAYDRYWTKLTSS
ncbi:spermidine/putrescine ABC transporter substrate-binding protein [Leptolyngbya sp. FACHB-17]|uniref:ABC transporter substrate-binding protein n=1 Tax=unclassified Leptolyngbya TaxID=2650499 RepID=UPI001680D175|nr:spermidine/putrescine ABC transporter substrate-binding protein [Leptolyngbya sp. FACHB-17]MBD2082975.1 spermidine/putrescine ABC transporter substrate-binding protein [Leptolyngbya sp. FACHB-17]